ncbi:general substrate transporter [Microdochium bolleyi]|uniref:General substrate transporter n=1 Tax=Microdochium bolleyi TaxID=196109 RepID=A0A136IPH9_9PEZI|nr:general substrate transporter [Microdochium bolleyi]
MADKRRDSEGVTLEEREKSATMATGLVDVKVAKGSGAYHEALLQEHPNWLHPRMMLLVACTMVGFCCQTMNGFDGSLFGGLTANSKFLDFFGGSNDGIWAGLVSAMYQIGGVCALPFVGPAIDTWGRRFGMFIGSFIVIIGTVISGTTRVNASVDQFMAGRFCLGFGVAIASAAGPIYVVETSHPVFRSVATAYCNTFWFVGSILSAGAVLGALDLPGITSWQIPVWLQLLFSGLICIGAFLVPESPRWCYVHNKRDKAKAILTKWHGLGDESSPWVQLQLHEYEANLNTEGSDKRWWDYRKLFDSRAARYRVACNCVFVVFAQWAGNGALTYFLPAVLDTVGYKADDVKARINLGYACFQFCFALVGAALVERIGRRPLMLFSMASCCICWVGVSAAAGTYNNSGETNSDAARAVIAMIFIFGAVFSVGITPLQALYPVEVLSFELRAKGMAFSNLCLNAAGLLNQFAWPVSLERIGWHTYFVFLGWCAVQTVVFYFFLPETKGRTLEELDEIFASEKPVKASLVKAKVAVDTNKKVVPVIEG